MSASAPVPYIAPWQSDWTRYSTQLVPLSKLLTGDYQVTVPDGQWWRVLFCSVAWVTTASAATRQALFKITRVDGYSYVIGSPTTQIASLEGFYTWAVGANAYYTPTNAGRFYQVAPIIDIVWPQASVITAGLDGALSGDDISGSAIVAVEVYTEADNGALVPSITPTPLIA